MRITSKMFVTIIILMQACRTLSVDMDVIDCGIDHALDVAEGEMDPQQYPWVGVLFYIYYGVEGDSRSVTTVVLIQKEFVIAPAANIGPMPKNNFRKNSRVLLGEGWDRPGRRVRNYVIHPEYGETYNTVALVQLSSPVRDIKIKPVCPPPDVLRNPVFYVIKMKEDLDVLEKEVVNVMHIPGKMCREFYIAANLYSRKMRPPYVACAVSVKADGVCVWSAGGALVSRDVWGRWQLLGLGVRGPGCGAPSRYLDMMSYYPWIEDSLKKFSRVTISKISKQKYVLRSSHAYQKFGNCDEEEKKNLVFRETIVLRTDNNQYQFLNYNLTIVEIVEYSCLTLELVNASAVSEMRVKHYCPRVNYGPSCYFYKGTVFDIAVYIMFSDKCLFELFAWGYRKNMTLLDIQEWKWEEGTYYEDFSMTRVEYRGQSYMTDFGFEPVDIGMWVPEYDVWTTTEYYNRTTTTPIPINVSRSRPTRSTSITKRRKATPKRRTRTRIRSKHKRHGHDAKHNKSLHKNITRKGSKHHKQKGKKVTVAKPVYKNTTAFPTINTLFGRKVADTTPLYDATNRKTTTLGTQNTMLERTVDTSPLYETTTVGSTQFERTVAETSPLYETTTREATTKNTY